jgi:hypothetical protein
MLMITRKLRQQNLLNWTQLSSALRPALLTAATLAAILGAVYSPVVLLRTLVPLSGFTAYRAQGYGFLSSGKNFWYFPGVRLGYYAGTVAGFWILATLLLAVIASTALVGLPPNEPPQHPTRGEPTSPRPKEMALCCAALHAAFVCFFFGSAFSWIYYPYILTMGVAAASTLGRVPRTAVWILSVVALVGLKTTVLTSCQRWSSTKPDAQTAALWAPRDELAEWIQVRKLIAQHSDPHAALLNYAGCGDLLFPEFSRPQTLFIAPGLSTPTEIERKVAQLSETTAVVVPIMYQSFDGFLSPWPQLRDALTNFHRTFQGKFFEVYSRTP